MCLLWQRRKKRQMYDFSFIVRGAGTNCIQQNALLFQPHLAPFPMLRDAGVADLELLWLMVCSGTSELMYIPVRRSLMVGPPHCEAYMVCPRAVECGWAPPSQSVTLIRSDWLIDWEVGRADRKEDNNVVVTTVSKDLPAKEIRVQVHFETTVVVSAFRWKSKTELVKGFIVYNFLSKQTGSLHIQCSEHWAPAD